MTSVARVPRMGLADRLAAVERRLDGHDQRADGHDQVIKPMAEQVAELYGLWTKVRTINWFIVKVAAIAGGAMGFFAVVLTIVANGLRLLTGH